MGDLGIDDSGADSVIMGPSNLGPNYYVGGAYFQWGSIACNLYVRQYMHGRSRTHRVRKVVTLPVLLEENLWTNKSITIAALMGAVPTVGKALSASLVRKVQRIGFDP